MRTSGTGAPLPYSVAAGNAGGSYYPERVGQELFRHATRVPPTAPGAQALNTGALNVAQRQGIFPRLAQGIGGVLRTRGVMLATRAIPSVAGAYLLWKIGSGLLAKNVPVQMQPEVATTEKYVWSGATGSCIDGGSKGNYVNPADTMRPPGTPNATNRDQYGCVSGLGNGNLTQRAAWVPSNTVAVALPAPDVAGQFRASSDCYFTAIAGSSKQVSSTSTYTLCTPVVPPNATNYLTLDGGYYSYSYKTYDGMCGSLKCYTVTNGSRTWYFDPLRSTPSLFPPTLERPSAWDGVVDSDPSVAQSDWPTMPTAQQISDKGAELDASDAEEVRDEADFVFDQTAPPADPIYGDPGGVVQPIGDYGPAYGSQPMPGCAGLTVAACESQLAAMGWTGTSTSPALSMQNADLTKPAGAIVTTSPAEGEYFANDGAVVFTVNPDPLPLVLPAPTPGETYDAYVARLQALGHVGTITRVDLDQATMDAQAGPSAVTTVTPATGTRIQTTSAVTLTVNPANAPAAGSGGGGCEPWVIPTLNLDPLLSMLDDATSVFPFGIPGWVVDSVDGLVAEPVTPGWDFKFPMADEPWRVDLAMFDPIMPAVRTVLLFGSMLGLGWFFFSMATGGGSQRREEP